MPTQPTPQTEPPSGFLLIDKPAGITSHDVIDKLRRITGIRKIGHAGTLDPFATGLLVVGVGRAATRRLEEMMGKDKEYVATAMLGASSDTQDLTGKITETENAPTPTIDEIKAELPQFVGDIQQLPPMFSAKKIKGKKLYELARKGEEIERQPSNITVHAFEVVSYEHPELNIRIHCGKGTYIRTLAHDLGNALNTGAYLSALRRTKSGDFSVEDAFKLDDLSPETWAENLLLNVS